MTPKIASAFAITIIRRCLTNNDTGESCPVVLTYPHTSDPADATKYRVDTKKLDTLADAVISLTSGNTDVELETLHALQDLMETLMHPESEFPSHTKTT